MVGDRDSGEESRRWGGSEGSHLQTRSPLLALMPREFPPFRAPLLVMALEMGWSTKLAWKPVTFWTGLKFSVARRKSSAKSVALLAKVAVPKSWLLIGESLVIKLLRLGYI